MSVRTKYRDHTFFFFSYLNFHAKLNYSEDTWSISMSYESGYIIPRTSLRIPPSVLKRINQVTYSGGKHSRYQWDIAIAKILIEKIVV